MKKDAKFYTVCLPLGIVCVTASEEDIPKELDAVLNDFLKSHSLEEITAVLATDIRRMELYRGLYTLLEQATAVNELEYALMYDKLKKQNEELQDEYDKLKKLIEHIQIQPLKAKDDTLKEMVSQHKTIQTGWFSINPHQGYTDYTKISKNVK